MTTLREAAQMALNALEHLQTDIEWQYKSPTRAMLRKVEKSLCAALAQIQPEEIISQEWRPANPDAKLRHYSLVLRDLDKTIEGWCEQPEFYLDGKRIDVTQQKPVAWRKKWEGDEDYTYYWMDRYKGSEPLYTAPPQREWQGLTDEEMFNLWVKCPAETEDRFAFARAIEAKLREKNT